MGRVVLLTDFGTADGYAAAMAGVVVSSAPGVLIEHAAHDIKPGDVFGAALALSRYALLYPAGTVHLAVVDPGVGTTRRPIAATIDGRHFVGPDNGLFTLVLRGAERARVVDVGRAGRGDAAAPTFHGRDLFAPAAAHLARGQPVEDLGPEVPDPVLLTIPPARRSARRIRGEVLHVDRFGSLITNIPADWVRGLVTDHPGARVRIGSRDVGGLRRTYGDVEPGGTVALIGSLDLLEVAVRDGDAGARLQAGRGAPVEVIAS